jgi:acyl carrier protein
MDVVREVLGLLDSTLNLNGRSRSFTRDTALLGAVPELDSMGVVAVITAMEERLGVSVDDDEIDGSTFATVGSLADFISVRVAG